MTHTFSVSWYEPQTLDGRPVLRHDGTPSLVAVAQLHEHQSFEAALRDKHWCEANLDQLLPANAYRPTEPGHWGRPAVSDITSPPKARSTDPDIDARLERRLQRIASERYPGAA